MWAICWFQEVACSLGIFPVEWRGPEADSYGWNEATYSGMKIAKVNNSEFVGDSLDSNNYEGGQPYWNFSRANADAERTVNGRRTSDFAVGAWEVGADFANCAPWRDLRRFGRRANVFGRVIFLSFRARWGNFRKWGKGSCAMRKAKWFWTHAWFCKFTGGRQKDVNKVNMLKGIRKSILQKRIFNVRNIYFRKGNSELKGWCA